MTRREKSSSTPHQYPHLKWVELYSDRRALVQNRFELQVASHGAVVSTRGDPILASSLCLLHRTRFAHSTAFAFGEVLHFELSWSCLAAVAAAPCDLLQARFTFGPPTRAIGEVYDGKRADPPSKGWHRESSDVRKRSMEPNMSKTPKLSRRILGRGMSIRA
jgi:hypothetical protein